MCVRGRLGRYLKQAAFVPFGRSYSKPRTLNEAETQNVLSTGEDRLDINLSRM